MKVLILDDDKAIREYISCLVQEIIPKGRVFEAESGTHALDILDREHIDLVLLDMELDKQKKKLGLDYATLMAKRHENVDFMVISGYDKYAIDAYEIHPFYYFLKPLDTVLFRKKLLEWYFIREHRLLTAPKSTTLKIMTKVGMAVIPYERIIFIEKEKRRVIVRTRTKNYISIETLKEIETKLDSRFYKTYQSFIVNMDMVSDVEMLENRSWEIQFADFDEYALLSRYKSKAFFETFNNRR